ncbi:MAG: F0F1 ATP synthase subunit B' [Rhodospirillaceae bacterium]|nr:F0F1 ATP synthase subunit B' [Rhodospirillaceae bacterium]
MPQLDDLTYGTQVFWLVITFAVLLILMWTIALPRIGRVLEQRRRHIDDDLADAEKFKKESEEAIKSYEASLSEARSKAHQLLAETQAKLDEQASDQRARLDAELAEKQAEAEARIREARQQALSSVREVAAEAARAATNRLIGVEPSQAAADAAVDKKG